MTIVLTGGGSGGHITPLLAVAHEIKQLQPNARVVYIGQRGDSLADIPAKNPDIDAVYIVRAGKFRRYSGQGVRQLIDVPTIIKNVRDSGRVVRGLSESRRLLKQLKPDVIFIKGGFVGVPVGFAAAQLHIPFITHDSDALPGLANRLIARWATAHAVALPKEIYSYPEDKTFTVGVPISHKFEYVTSNLKEDYRKKLGLTKYKRIIFVTGGGNGARQLNKIVTASSKSLLERYEDLAIVHLAGRAFMDETEADYSKELTDDLRDRVILKDFITDLYAYSGVADVIVGRGSATNLAEFALQGKACIIIPAPQLIWTVKNTEALVKRGAVVALDEEQLLLEPKPFIQLCEELLDSPARRHALAAELSKALAHPDAARELAQLLIRQEHQKN